MEEKTQKMILKAIKKSSSSFVRPLIRKGYYAAQLIDIKPYLQKDSDEFVVGKYGKQIILDFKVFKSDPESGELLGPVMFKPTEDGEEKEVILSKFVYHIYKQKDGTFESAIKPGTIITKVFEALGWKFTEGDFDPMSLIGNVCELNINDYEKVTGDEKIIFSTIDSIQIYKGSPGKIPEVEPKSKPEEKPVEVNPEVEEIQKKIAEAKQQNKDELLTDAGLATTLETLEARLRELK